MPDAEPPTALRVGLPDPRSVLSQTLLAPATSPEGAAADEPAGPRLAYRILRTNQTDPYDTAQEPDEALLAELALAQAPGDEFRGTARKAAKISISHVETEVFTDLADLIATLPSHAEMVNHDPPIKTGATSGRVEKEHRNVRVRAFLYAASREDDNDYHLIVGRDPDKSPMYMTVELSGTPPESSAHFERLMAARTVFKEFFRGDPSLLPGLSYDFYDPPIEMDVEGSLFFDIGHAHGSRPGPASLRDDMPVIWEIHPISELVMEP